LASCASLRGVPTTAQTACFATDRLAPADRLIAERIVLEFSDREGLYTLAGGLKPVSSDVRNLTLRIAPTVDTVALARVEQLRRVADALTCGDIGVFLQVFTATSIARDSGVVRNASLVMYHRSALRGAIQRQRDFFASLGITQSADPREVIGAVENAPRADRWRGYGYLFGYPNDAVDFFVRAGVEGDSTRQLVPRDFRRIETWQRFPERAGGPAVLSAFVYAVARDAPESEGDRALRERAAPIFAQYRAMRARFVRGDSTGAIAMWREWYGRR